MKMTKSEQLNDIEIILSHLSHFATNEDIAKKLFAAGYRKINKGDIITTKSKIASLKHKSVKDFYEKLNEECMKNGDYDDDAEDMPFVSGRISIIDIYNVLKEWENENR